MLGRIFGDTNLLRLLSKQKERSTCLKLLTGWAGCHLVSGKKGGTRS